jgi:hypothetical protein
LRATALQRAGTIYSWHVGAYFAALVVLALNAWITGAQSTTSPQLFNENPLLASVLGPLLVYQPGLLDILPMYCLFVLLLPPCSARWSRAGSGACCCRVLASGSGCSFCPTMTAR